MSELKLGDLVRASKKISYSKSNGSGQCDNDISGFWFSMIGDIPVDTLAVVLDSSNNTYITSGNFIFKDAHNFFPFRKFFLCSGENAGDIVTTKEEGWEIIS